MAMVCKNDARECSGCMECEGSETTREIVGTCDYCGDDIIEGELIYEINGETIHRKCLRDWAADFKEVATR